MHQHGHYPYATIQKTSQWPINDMVIQIGIALSQVTMTTCLQQESNGI